MMHEEENKSQVPDNLQQQLWIKQQMCYHKLF